MNDKEIIQNFINTARAIYKLCQMDADGELPETVTVGATLGSGKQIEINITIKDEKEEDVQW